MNSISQTIIILNMSLLLPASCINFYSIRDFPEVDSENRIKSCPSTYSISVLNGYPENIEKLESRMKSNIEKETAKYLRTVADVLDDLGCKKE